MISSPGWIPRCKKIKLNACDPLVQSNACFLPERFSNSDSTCFVYGPLKTISDFSAILCVVFYCTYVISINEKLIITTPLILYGIVRYNFLSNSKKFSDSPVDEIIKDKQNIFLIIIWLTLIIISKIK